MDGFHERMHRLLLMAPLYALQRRRKLSFADGSEVTGMELGMVSLLYFFELMLGGTRKGSVRELAAHLQDKLAPFAVGDAKDKPDYEKLAREIITAFRPATGRRSQEEFFNLETGRSETAQYSYIKAYSADIDSNEQFYALDEHGLELIFITKEFFSEYQLSINQLILRKQLERGQFALALRQVEEMRLDVETIRQNIVNLKGEMHRNIVSDDTLERYRKLVEDINNRLKGEEAEFKELKNFVRETKARIRENGDLSANRMAYENISEVEARLDLVHGKHSQLLLLGIELGTTALKEAQDALFFTSLDSFNFEQEITSRFFGSPLPIGAARQLINPFFQLQQATVWSPLSIFQPQRLEKQAGERPELSFPDLAEDEEKPEIIRAIQQLNGRICQLLAGFMAAGGGGREALLGDFCAYVEQHEGELLATKQFFMFWILLHRKGTLLLADKEMSEKSPYYLMRSELSGLEDIHVSELPGRDVLEYPLFKISNMQIRVNYKNAVFGR